VPPYAAASETNSDTPCLPLVSLLQEHLIHVKQRPHLHTFMERVAELFEVVVFTASQRIYAEKLLNIIDPTRRVGACLQQGMLQRYCYRMLQGRRLALPSAVGQAGREAHSRRRKAVQDKLVSASMQP
jgi:hypothetical protein